MLRASGRHRAWPEQQTTLGDGEREGCARRQLDEGINASAVSQRGVGSSTTDGLHRGERQWGAVHVRDTPADNLPDAVREDVVTKGNNICEIIPVCLNVWQVVPCVVCPAQPMLM